MGFNNIRLHGSDQCEAEMVMWKAALREDSYEAYERYLLHYPNGMFADIAEEKADELFWKRAEEKNTIEAYQEYLDKFAYGRYREKAQEKIGSLKALKVGKVVLGVALAGLGLGFF